MSAERIRAYARAHGLTLADARRRLLDIALDHLEARREGGRLRGQQGTVEERQSRARAAAHARWQQAREKS